MLHIVAEPSHPLAGLTRLLWGTLGALVRHGGAGSSGAGTATLRLLGWGQAKDGSLEAELGKLLSSHAEASAPPFPVLCPPPSESLQAAAAASVQVRYLLQSHLPAAVTFTVCRTPSLAW
jgi:hypothetical protein